MGKYRILYPTVTQAHGIEGEAGDEVTIDDDLAEALIAPGFVEAVTSKRASSEDKPAAKRTTTKK
jgi:predicted alpha/beta-fold hydrolase